MGHGANPAVSGVGLPNARIGRKRSSVAPRLDRGLATEGGPQQYVIAAPSGFRLLRPCHIRMMAAKRSDGKYDPPQLFAASVASALAEAGTTVGGCGALSALLGCRGSGDWRSDVAATGRRDGRPGCNSIVCGHSGNRQRIPDDIPGRLVAGGPLHSAWPCVPAGGTGQLQWLRVTLETAWYVT